MPGPNPMYRSPHKKKNGWAKGYLPEFGRFPHHHNQQGNCPPGKKKKKDRVKQQLPGQPQGTHLMSPKDGQICICGGCYDQNIDKLVVW